jgi:type IV pilus assembly protein PilA
MKSAKCPKCGFVGWPDAEFCKKCGAAMLSAPVDMAHAPAGNFTPSYSPYNVSPQAQLKTGLAVASLVIGILNLLLFGIFVLPAVAGIIMSAIALNKIQQYPHEYGGKSLAIGGLVTNIVAAVFLVPVMIIASIAIPNLLASRRAANEGSAMKSLVRIHSAEVTYESTVGNGHFGTLDDLKIQSLIASDFANEARYGYRFRVEVIESAGSGNAGFHAIAVPTEYGSSGVRSFFIDETGVLRAEDSHGLDASRYAPPVGFERYPESRSERRRSLPSGDD